MGCYGIGPSRLMGLIAEHFADDKGLVWPVDVAPVKVYLARLGDNEAAVSQADELYELLTNGGVSVLYDDRDVRPGQKFADADLMGIPYRVIASDKTAEAGTYEFKSRQSDDSEQLNKDNLLKALDITT